MGELICSVADLHVANHRRFGGAVVSGLNDRARAIVGTLNNAVVQMLRRGGRQLVVLGDLFDTASPSPQLITAVMDVLAERDFEVHLLLGNHDLVSDAPGDHAFGPFHWVPNVTIHVRPVVVPLNGVDLVMVPYQSGPAQVWLPGVLHALLGQRPHRQGVTRRVLALHLGVHDRVLRERYPWAGTAHDAIPVEHLVELSRMYGISQIVAGNWHGRQSWEFPDSLSKTTLSVMQVGALVPTGWDNPGLDGYGTVALAGDDGLSYVEVPGPRFVAVASRKELDLRVEAAGENGLYVRWVCLPDQVKDALEVLEGLKVAGKIAGYSVELDQGDAKVKAREAAEGARRAETLLDALSAFVRELPLEVGIDRAEVLERSREYLGR